MRDFVYRAEILESDINSYFNLFTEFLAKDCWSALLAKSLRDDFFYDFDIKFIYLILTSVIASFFLILDASFMAFADHLDASLFYHELRWWCCFGIFCFCKDFRSFHELQQEHAHFQLHIAPFLQCFFSENRWHPGCPILFSRLSDWLKCEFFQSQR